MSYHCKAGWGIDSLKQASSRSDLVVIVDTLSFSTAVTTAIWEGAKIYPFTSQSDANNFAEKNSIERAVHRDKVPFDGIYSLSPLTYKNMEPGIEIALYSLNGATLCNNTDSCPIVLVGTLLNAKNVAAVAAKLAEENNINITIIAAGEIEVDKNGKKFLRKAEEDLVGAGAILSYLTGSKCSKAKLAEEYFHQHKNNLQQLLVDCPSGKYLFDRGFGDDVIFASNLNSKPVVPILRGNFLSAL